MLTDEDIAFRTDHHPSSSPEVVRAHQALRQASADFLKAICSNTPSSREQSLALTKAEEAMMWANAAIARTQKIGPDNA